MGAIGQSHHPSACRLVPVQVTDRTIENVFRAMSVLSVMWDNHRYCGRFSIREGVLMDARRCTKVVGAIPYGKPALMPVAARLRHVTSTSWAHQNT